MYNNRSTAPTPVTIRVSRPADERALRRLAQRDTRALPEGELLVALVAGEPRAAISLATGELVADPFHRTEDLVRMLAMRWSELNGSQRRLGRRPTPLPGQRPALAG